MKLNTELSMRKLFLLGASAWAMNFAAYAQETPEEEPATTLEVIEEDSDEDESVQERIVVTGSRLQRSEFSSTSPVQILRADVSRAAGLVSAADILQTSTANSGLQIDATFNGFVLDNGPGASEVNLRGLGAGRTLLLVNNRRISPAGVEGAPAAPDLNLIPSILLDRIEVLLDGASSIYGADAVAGVANVILRDDIEGFEIAGEISQPFEAGGEEVTLSAAWGTTSDDGYFGFGAEYNDRRRIRFADRDDVSLCTQNIFTNRDPSRPAVDTLANCELSLINRTFLPIGFGSIYYTPGSTNIGIPNFTESQTSIVDADGDGLPDVDIFDPLFNNNASARQSNADFVSPLERWSIYAYGENDIGDSGNAVFFEALYSNRRSSSNGGPSQIFPTVPGDNPFSPCNEDEGGVNCLGFFGVNFGNQDTLPILSVVGDRESVTAEVAQTRFVGGIRGDIDFLGSVGLDNWTYEASAQYSQSQGTSTREGILNDRLTLSLQTSVRDPNTGEIVCGIDIDGDGLPDSNSQIGIFGDEDLLSVPCVPVNLYAPSLYVEGGGTFATQEETDYLFGTRNFTTTIEQTIYQGIVQGDVFELPWNGAQVPLVLGFEYRDESIDSQPDIVARDGLLFGFFADQGATGRRDLYEAFAETEITPIRGMPFAEELTLNLSTRWTEESNFGALWTYSAKAKYRPVDWLALNGTIGTSYRAPDLRQQFLAGSTGFNTLTDPCVVPE
ncbi:MAG: TonB-dependent receptor, partial [Pseudomonadota bacterium]